LFNDADSPPKRVLTGTKSRIFVLSLGAGVTPAEGSVKPAEGFTFNQVLLFAGGGCRLLKCLRYGSIACSGSIEKIPLPENDFGGRKIPDLLTDLAGRNSKPSEAGPDQ